MKNKFLQATLHYMKQFLLATFYGFRQVMFQVLVLLPFEWLINEDFFFESLAGFTMLYYWFAVFVPKNKRLIRFAMPYISWMGIMSLTIGFHRLMIGNWLMGLSLPFISCLFFKLEDYLKKRLATRQKLFKWAKVLGIAFGALTSFLFIPILWSSTTEMTAGHCRPSTEQLFDETKELAIETGLDFPEYKVTKYTKNHISYRGFYSDEWAAEFVEMPSKEFFNTIDSLSRIVDSNWELVHGEIYSFSRGIEYGRNSDFCHSLQINLKPDSKTFHIYFGGMQF